MVVGAGVRGTEERWAGEGALRFICSCQERWRPPLEELQEPLNPSPKSPPQANAFRGAEEGGAPTTHFCGTWVTCPLVLRAWPAPWLVGVWAERLLAVGQASARLVCCGPGVSPRAG